MDALRNLAASPWTYRVLRSAGVVLLLGYLRTVGHANISWWWALCYPLIAISVAYALILARLPTLMPALNGYFTPHQMVKTTTEVEWGALKAGQLVKNIRGMFVSPAEDGLFCVPVLLAGINPISALCAGALFGVAHLGSYSYLECLGKAIYYSAVCLILLPHGLLKVVVGHVLSNVIWMGALLAIRQRLAHSGP